ncbi:MAG: phosphatase PAP2 family protein [Gallionella sp.]
MNALPSSMKISPNQFPGQTVPWHIQILTRMRSHFFLKTSGITLFMLAFFTGYIYLLKHPVFAVTVMPVTALDDAVGFHPYSIFLYVSLWLYVSLPPALFSTRRELINYGWAVGGLCLAGLACFLLWPTAVPPANIDWANSYGFSMLKGVDATGNACPSLHVATAVFSAAWLGRQLLEVGAPRVVRISNWLWCAGIAYSTLATKQHVAVDMLAGIVLGALAAALSLNRPSFWPIRSRLPEKIEPRRES